MRSDTKLESETQTHLQLDIQLLAVLAADCSTASLPASTAFIATKRKHILRGQLKGAAKPAAGSWMVGPPSSWSRDQQDYFGRLVHQQSGTHAFPPLRRSALQRRFIAHIGGASLRSSI